MIAVNHIEPKEDGDVQARFLHRNMLVVICLFRSDHIEHGANLAFGDKVVIGEVRSGRPGRKSGGVLDELANFFFERHLLQERLGARVHLF